MSKPQKLVPKLRFPEFEKNGEWEEQELGTLAERIILKNKEGKIDKVFTNSAAHGIVDQRDFFDKDIANKSNLQNYYVVEDGDYVYNPRISSEAPVGPTSKNKSGQTGVMSPLYTVFRFSHKSNQFFEYYFISRHWFNSIRTSSNTGARFDRMSISDSAFMGIPVLSPQLREQQKIASCLSSLDELIAAHNDKLDALKDHKKGLLQNLFPKQGETVPKVRFPEFKDDGEWVEKKLGEISHKIMVGIASAATQAYRKSGIILFRNQNIKEGYLDDRDILYIDEEYEKAHKNKRLKAGDLLTARTGYPGTTCVVPKKYEGSQSFTTLISRPDNSIVNSDFLCLFINSEKGQSFFEATKIGGGQKNVNAGSLTEMPILFPAMKEQQKIAACLSAVDELISAQQEKIKQLQQHKKGLMQGLFPKFES